MNQIHAFLNGNTCWVLVALFYFLSSFVYEIVDERKYEQLVDHLKKEENIHFLLRLAFYLMTIDEECV